jgi:hypothetical protein
MDPRVYIEYEVIDPVSNKRVFTQSREEALAHFDRECLVYERHITLCRVTTHEEAKLSLTTLWNNSPRF